MQEALLGVYFAQALVVLATCGEFGFGDLLGPEVADLCELGVFAFDQGGR